MRILLTCLLSCAAMTAEDPLESFQAQRRYAEALRARMPHPRLELKLAKACEALGEVLGPDPDPKRDPPWRPQVELWIPAAKRQLPKVEAMLRCWPESGLGVGWRAWMGWSAFLPSPPDPTALAESLPLWKTRRRGGEGPLPLRAVGEVSAALARDRRWSALTRWCSFHWSGGWSRAVGRTRRAVADASADAARLALRKELAEALARPYLQSLEMQGRKVERRALLMQIGALDPAFARELGAP
jgi:hypothetical protein